MRERWWQRGCYKGVKSKSLRMTSPLLNLPTVPRREKLIFISPPHLLPLFFSLNFKGSVGRLLMDSGSSCRKQPWDSSFDETIFLQSTSLQVQLKGQGATRCATRDTEMQMKRSC